MPLLSVITILLSPVLALASTPSIDHGPFPADLNGSNFTYPFPIKLYHFTSQDQALSMTFMDIPPSRPNPTNKTALLLHGKNFCSATWLPTITFLTSQGYRVLAPDQIGFCKSSKPGSSYQFSLAQLAHNTHALLTALALPATAPLTIIGHSLGGMLAVRYALLYPSPSISLALVNPIGLEDWLALGVPYNPIDVSLVAERASTYDSIRAYEQATYYPGAAWTAAFDEPVVMLAGIYGGSEGEAFAAGQARVVDMVLTQPVVYELERLRVARTLLVIGGRDTTAIGKQWASEEVQKRLGRYEVLGREAAARIPNSTLVELADLGHTPQLQAPERVHEALLEWLEG